MLEVVIALSNFFSVSEYSFHGCFPDSAIVVREKVWWWVKTLFGGLDTSLELPQIYFVICNKSI